MFSKAYLAETEAIAAMLNPDAIEDIVEVLRKIRSRSGRVFVLGLGGSHANAEHCVNDLRCRAGLQAYTPTIAEWTARANDEGWAIALKRWLEGSRLQASDAVIVLSGSGESLPLVLAARHAERAHSLLIGILGAANSTLARLCDHLVLIPCPPDRRAGHAETFQSVVWHCVVAHPRLAV